SSTSGYASHLHPGPQLPGGVLVVLGDRGPGYPQELVREWVPELADTRLQQITWPAIAEHHKDTARQLRARGEMAGITRCRRLTSGCETSMACPRAWRACGGMWPRMSRRRPGGRK